MKAVIACLALALSACTAMVPNSLNVDVEHYTRPLTDQVYESAQTQATATLQWRTDTTYLDAGVGVYGPTVTGVLRAGVEFRLK